jgi:hypothetical protein
MTSAKVRLLAVALGLATLPLAACRHNDRYDKYESSAYRSDRTSPTYSYDNSGGYGANNAGTHGANQYSSHYNDYNRTYDNSGGYGRDNPGTNGANSQTRSYDNNGGYWRDNTSTNGANSQTRNYDNTSSRTYDSSMNSTPYDRGTTEPGSTSFSRLTGNLSTTLDADFAKAQSAAEKAFTDLGYTITDRKNEDKKSVIEAKSPEKDSVKITLKRKSDTQTDATIGVGMTGKQSRADLVLEKLLEDMK